MCMAPFSVQVKSQDSRVEWSLGALGDIDSLPVRIAGWYRCEPKFSVILGSVSLDYDRTSLFGAAIVRSTRLVVDD